MRDSAFPVMKTESAVTADIEGKDWQQGEEILREYKSNRKKTEHIYKNAKIGIEILIWFMYNCLRCGAFCAG